LPGRPARESWDAARWRLSIDAETLDEAFSLLRELLEGVRLDELPIWDAQTTRDIVIGVTHDTFTCTVGVPHEWVTFAAQQGCNLEVASYPTVGNGDE